MRGAEHPDCLDAISMKNKSKGILVPPLYPHPAQPLPRQLVGKFIMAPGRFRHEISRCGVTHCGFTCLGWLLAVLPQFGSRVLVPAQNKLFSSIAGAVQIPQPFVCPSRGRPCYCLGVCELHESIKHPSCLAVARGCHSAWPRKRGMRVDTLLLFVPCLFVGPTGHTCTTICSVFDFCPATLVP